MTIKTHLCQKHCIKLLSEMFRMWMKLYCTPTHIQEDSMTEKERDIKSECELEARLKKSWGQGV